MNTIEIKKQGIVRKAEEQLKLLKNRKENYLHEACNLDYQIEFLDDILEKVYDDAVSLDEAFEKIEKIRVEIINKMSTSSLNHFSKMQLLITILSLTDWIVQIPEEDKEEYSAFLKAFLVNSDKRVLFIE